MNPHFVLAVAVLFITILALSDASLLDESRKLGQHQPKLPPLEQKISPMPAYSPAPNGGHASSDSVSLVQTPNISPAPAAGSSGSASVERCSTTSLRCHDLGTMAACLQPSLTAPKEFYLLVQNDGDKPLKVNVTISHAKVGYQDMHIPKYETKKIILSTNVGESPLIVLNAGNGECRLGASTSEGNSLKKLPYANLLTPIHGAYFLLAVALVVGATYACCKLRARGRQGDEEHAYHELEMGQPESLSANIVEPADLDEDWVDDWDQIKAVESPNGHQTGNPLADGLR